MWKAILLLCALVTLACSPAYETESGPIAVASGGVAVATGGESAVSGGASSTGGATASGGAATGGIESTGGAAPETGGASATGGIQSAGGTIEPATGGAPPVEPIWSRRVTINSPVLDVDKYTTAVIIEVSDLASGSNCAFATEALTGPGVQSWAAPQPQRPHATLLCLYYEPAIKLRRVLSPGPYIDSSSGYPPEHAGLKTGSPAGLVVTVESLQLSPLVATVLVEYF